MTFWVMLILLTGVVRHMTQGVFEFQEELYDAYSNLTRVLEYSLGAMTDDIVQRYFFNTLCVGIVTQTSSDSSVSQVTSYAASYVLTVDIDEMEDLLLKVLDAPCLAFVLQVADPTVLLNALADVSRRGVQRANRRYLVLPLGIQPSPSVLDMRVMAYMPDLLEATLLPDGGIVVATHRYVGVTTWKDRVELDVWRDGTWERGADLYPDKFADLGGRHFVIATLHYPPYMVVHLKEHIYDGIELRVCQEFARKHNMTWDIHDHYEEQWGEVYSNFTGTGILGSVLTDRSDVGFGALYTWYEEYQLLDFTYPYMIVHITCLAPRPRPLGGWLTPVYPFSTSVWQALGASVVVGSVLVYSITKLSRKVLGLQPCSKKLRYSTLLDCFLRTLGLLALQAPPRERREGSSFEPTRHILTWFLIVFVLVTCCYCSGLASVLVVPRYGSPIDTVTDLVQRGMQWAHTHEAFVFSLRGATEPLTRSLVDLFLVMDTVSLRQRSTTGDLAFPVERLQADHFAIGDFINDVSAATLRVMKGNLYSGQVTTITRKGSPLTEPLNTLIHQLQDAGLVLQWEGQVSRRFESVRLQMAVQLSDDGPSIYDPPKLDVMHVEGCFGLLMLGLALSSIVFIIEVMMTWLPQYSQKMRTERSRFSHSVKIRRRLKRTREIRSRLIPHKLRSSRTVKLNRQLHMIFKLFRKSRHKSRSNQTSVFNKNYNKTFVENFLY